MKLSKRIAAAVLAALMAVSMMTACGGNSSSNKPSSSSKPSSGKPASSASTSGSSSNSNSGSTTENLPDLDKGSGKAIKWQNSYVSQATKKMQAAPSYAMKATVFDDASMTKYMTVYNAVSKDKTYVHYLEGNTNNHWIGTEFLYTGDYLYQIYQDAGIALKVKQPEQSGTGTLPEVDTALKVEQGTKTVKGVKYYAEKVTAVYDVDGQKETLVVTYCLNQKKEIEYIFMRNSGAAKDSMIMHISEYTTKVDQSLFTVPKDCMIVETVVVDQYNYYFVDDNGKAYSEEQKAEILKRLSKVSDSN